MVSAHRLRVRGALLALSAPVSGILSYAAVATVIGEDRLEGSDGLSALGWMAMAPPLLAGLALIGWSLTERPLPSGRTVGIGLLASGLILVVLGLVAAASGEVGDANIGSGLLVLAGVPLVVFGAAALRPIQEPDPV